MIDPFANDSQSMQIGELIIENQQDKVIIYGDIDLYRNEQGLMQAKQLLELSQRLVAALSEQDTDQTDKDSAKSSEQATVDSVQATTTDNPFL